MLQNMAHRTWKEEIPVVLITSENSDNALLKGYELGVSDIINKPFNPNIVKRRVDNTIELYLHKRHLEALVRQQVETLEKQTLKLNRFNEFIIDTLSTVVEFRSCESGTHIRRVREITRLLLESLSFRYPEYDLPHGAIDKMVSAASMHDIGKIAIPGRGAQQTGQAHGGRIRDHEDALPQGMRTAAKHQRRAGRRVLPLLLRHLPVPP